MTRGTFQMTDLGAAQGGMTRGLEAAKESLSELPLASIAPHF